MFDLQIISRAEAKAKGLKWYFLGPDKPCRKGHVAKRRVTDCNCIDCDTERSRQSRTREYRRKYRLKNREKLIAYARKYRRESPEERTARQMWHLGSLERVEARWKKYYLENREKEVTRQRKYRLENPEKVAGMNRKYFEKDRLENPEKYRANNRNYNARKRDAEGKHTAVDIRLIRKRQDDRCVAPGCGVKLHGKGHVDHIIPLVRGGTNWPSNLALLCARCNQSKGTKLPADFAAERGFLL